jgi:OOP family OmpA-OmpF porin
MRKLLLVFCVALLAACQTTPRKPGFSSRQVALLQQEGFQPQGENYWLGLSDRVLFEFDRSDLTVESGATIDRLSKALLSVGIHGAAVEGHSDSTGPDDYNQALSERRAASVKAGLGAGGMEAAQVRASGVGEARPIASNDTEEGRAQNRRVVIIVTPADAN